MASGDKFSDCCVSRFDWEGKPTGQETKLAGLDAYVTGSADADAAILLIHDIWGWKFPNLRLISDFLAKQVGARVVLPDFFGGEVVPSDIFTSGKWESFHKGFVERNSKEKRRGSMLDAARELRKNHKRVGAIGYCFGGWAVFQLGAKEHNPEGKPLVDCISTPHPSWLTKEEIQAVGVPVQIQSSEHDPVYTEELKEFSNKVIPTLGVPYEYVYFPGVAHGFAVKADLKDAKAKAAMRRSIDSAVYWFKLWLKTEEMF